MKSEAEITEWLLGLIEVRDRLLRIERDGKMKSRHVTELKKVMIRIDTISKILNS